MVNKTDPVLENVRTVAELERQASYGLRGLERLSRMVTDVAESRVFILGHAAWFVLWVFVLNTRADSFDPYPFNLLNLFVSLEAIFLTSFVLMTQTRMTKQADRRAHIDLQVNLLAEQELTAILQMVYALCRNAGTCARVTDTRVEQLLRDTDIIKVAVAIEQELAEIDEATNLSTDHDET